jgi:hypothetical protein
MVALATGSTSLAGQLDAQQRQDLAVVVLVGGCVTDLARQNEVSRKFIYQQKEQAQQALQESQQFPVASEVFCFSVKNAAITAGVS